MQGRRGAGNGVVRDGKAPKCLPMRLSCLHQLEGRNLCCGTRSRPLPRLHTAWWPSVYQEKRNAVQERGPARSLSTTRCLSGKASLQDQSHVDCKENILPTKPRPSEWREGDIRTDQMLAAKGSGEPRINSPQQLSGIKTSLSARLYR